MTKIRHDVMLRLVKVLDVVMITLPFAACWIWYYAAKTPMDGTWQGHITLLRRASGYNESIRLRLKLWPNAGVWAGNLLNLLLYVPYGTTSWQWRREGKKIVAVGFALSVFCEVLQYLTGRGMADVNDVLFNTLGTLTGVCIAKRLVKE